MASARFVLLGVLAPWIALGCADDAPVPRTDVDAETDGLVAPDTADDAPDDRLADAPRDAFVTPDATLDASVDAVTDALRDASLDTPIDAVADVTRDAVADVTRDTTLDTPGDVARDVAVAPDVARDVSADASVVNPLDPSRAPPIDTDPTHYPANVWITSAMAKVQPDATPGAVHWATMSAARNEFESFQVHVRAGTTAISGLTVSLGDLTDARSGTVIRAADRAVVFREEYLTITTPSDLNGLRGAVPDPLIPAVDPWLHEPRNAFPATVPAASTRSYWVEVHVPPGTPSGYYAGTVTVRAGASTLAAMPVRLKVWGFELPSTSSLPNFFAVSDDAFCTVVTGSYRACGAYPGAGGSADRGVEITRVLTARFLLDYRITNAETPYAGTDLTTWSTFDALYGPLLDGTADTRLRGARMTSLAYVGVPDDYALVERWSRHARDRGWSDRLLYYHCDEPPLGCSFAMAAAEERAVHALSPPVATLLTTGIDELRANRMEDAVDIVTPLLDVLQPRDSASTRSRYDAFLAMPGKRLWWYQDCTEHESCTNGRPGSIASLSPSYMIDASPMRNRVFQWMAHLYRIGGELYYGTDYCWNHACGATVRDPWSSAYALGGNGEGTLMYPGLPSRIGGSSPVPIPSIRLSLIRDGLEDYEYLRALTIAGESAFADAQSRTFITTAHVFSNDASRLAAAREALGDRLHERALR